MVGGAGGQTVEDRRIQDFEIIRGGASYTGTPPLTPPNFQVLTAEQVGQSETSSAGASVQAESGASNQALVEPVGRQAANEVSLSLTVASSLDAKRIHRVG